MHWAIFEYTAVMAVICKKKKIDHLKLILGTKAWVAEILSLTCNVALCGVKKGTVMYIVQHSEASVRGNWEYRDKNSHHQSALWESSPVN